MITIEATGPLALLQDLGRPNCAYLGVSPSGAADRTALRLGNRLVGNPEDTTTIETTFGGLLITFDERTWVAVTGAPTEVVVNGTPTSSHTSIAIRPGDRLGIEAPPNGVRNYVAVRGGIEAPATLGSRSTDVLSGLGPGPLQPGDQFRIGGQHGDLPDVDLAPPRQPCKRLTIFPGPRADWFTVDAWRHLLADRWTVTADCNRVAVRLEGAGLDRVRTEELPSEGLLRGAIQVPNSGQPLIFLSDHPVTGGYPVIGVVEQRACDHAGQLRPGDGVHFMLHSSHRS